MDQKRLLTAVALSLGILLVFQFISTKYFPPPLPSPAVTQPAGTVAAAAQAGAPGTAQTAPAVSGPRLPINATDISGSIGLTGAVFDDVVLKNYHETVAKDSPLVQVMGRRGGSKPSYAQFGWTAADGESVKLPNDNTVWTASAPALDEGSKITLSWDNGAGLTFQLLVSIDSHYMFTVQQQVVNHTGAPVTLFPWSRVVRDYKPDEQSSYVLFDGPEGVFNNALKQISYGSVKSDGKNAPDGVAFTETSAGGWIGITDKYWLTALAPDQSANEIGTMSYHPGVKDGDGIAYQTAFTAADPEVIAPGQTAGAQTHFFAGAKVVKLLDAYQAQYGIPNFYKSVDFGHLYILTKPIFFALDYLNGVLGNFGLAILAFTLGMKIVLFPLANYSYRSMGKMKLLAPKMKEIKELHKDDPAAQQKATMELYKTEKINPASGCLPLLVQMPIFFALYKVIFITIEMRHAPFYGWIKDLSAQDPTNLFNLFGLVPFDPASLNPALHMGALPIIMGVTMFLQQRLNPPPPDPVQARMFQFMPIIVTFFMARSPAGLVLYWAWNNLLSVGQQWLIMRQASQPKA
jgi:YidC/Oxa1 family membrane protein insertase